MRSYSCLNLTDIAGNAPHIIQNCTKCFTVFSSVQLGLVRPRRFVKFDILSSKIAWQLSCIRFKNIQYSSDFKANVIKHYRNKHFYKLKTSLITQCIATPHRLLFITHQSSQTIHTTLLSVHLVLAHSKYAIKRHHCSLLSKIHKDKKTNLVKGVVDFTRSEFLVTKLKTFVTQRLSPKMYGSL